MSISETIHPDHLGRLAVVYIRQSTPVFAVVGRNLEDVTKDKNARPGTLRIVSSELKAAVPHCLVLLALCDFAMTPQNSLEIDHSLCALDSMARPLERSSSKVLP